MEATGAASLLADEKEKEHVKHVPRLMLDGHCLPTPRMHESSLLWVPGQIFRNGVDDPDRLEEHWTPPSFVFNPPASGRTWSQELQIDNVVGRSDRSFARVIYGVLSPSECYELLCCVNVKGFNPAMVGADLVPEIDPDSQTF